MASKTVTIDAAYLETLLRRAQFHSGGVEYPPPLNTVTIPKHEHESLLESSRQYTNLRRNLFRGGIAEETLDILIKDDTATNEIQPASNYSTTTETNGGAFLTQPQPLVPGTNGQSFTFGRNSSYTPRSGGLRERDNNTNEYQNHSPDIDDGVMPDGPDAYFEGESGNNDSQNRGPRQQFEKFAKRTVLLANLPEGTTHQDIVDVVRGGMILDIYLRTHDRAASISFLEEVAAQDFFRHVKRHDLYIKGKRVEIRWNDRQFILPGHVANKIAIGATRNFVIYNRSPRHTEETIREDLDHIHNLVVVSIRFGGQNAYISLNSVHNAMFARTCMMSRSTYKGYKIDWYNDECAAPLEAPAPRKNSIPTKKKDAPIMNRFHLLNIDDEEGTGSEEDDHDTSGITIATAMTPSLGIAA